MPSLSISLDFCPISHQYAFDLGLKCCQSRYEEDGLEATCNGSSIEIASTCCKNNEWVGCPLGRCKNYDHTQGKYQNYDVRVIMIRFVHIGSQCSTSYPYAYRGGLYCCQNAYEMDAGLGQPYCDGGTINIGSLCCENNEYTACPAPHCKNNDEGKSDKLSHVYLISPHV